MNRWKCEHVGCPSTAVGVGGAVGLRALGWYFAPGPIILCPCHRPDPVPCVGGGAAPCSVCRAEAEAARIQGAL